MIRGFLRTFRGLPDARGENAPWSPVVSGRQVCQTPHMRKITHVLAVPTALVLAAGLAACKLPGTSTSSETSASEPTSTSSPAPVPTVPSIASTSGGGNVPTVPASPTPSKRSIRAADLKVSDCFSKSGGSGTEISTVDVVDCSVPHQYEVYNIYTISASTLPTGDDMETEASSLSAPPPAPGAKATVRSPARCPPTRMKATPPAPSPAPSRTRTSSITARSLAG